MTTWCDVVLINACHLLFGDPWQFDRVTIHDSTVNTYSFVYNGTKISLLPMADNQNDGGKSSTFQNLFLSHSLFKKSFHETQKGVLLMLFEENTKQNLISMESQDLLHTFVDIFVQDILTGLSPKREVQHAIDLMPGSVIPN